MFILKEGYSSYAGEYLYLAGIDSTLASFLRKTYDLKSIIPLSPGYRLVYKNGTKTDITDDDMKAMIDQALSKVPSWINSLYGYLKRKFSSNEIEPGVYKISAKHKDPSGDSFYNYELTATFDMKDLLNPFIIEEVEGRFKAVTKTYLLKQGRLCKDLLNALKTGEWGETGKWGESNDATIFPPSSMIFRDTEILYFKPDYSKFAERQLNVWYKKELSPKAWSNYKAVITALFSEMMKKKVNCYSFDDYLKFADVDKLILWYKADVIENGADRTREIHLTIPFIDGYTYEKDGIYGPELYEALAHLDVTKIKITIR